MTATGYVGGDPRKLDKAGYSKGQIVAANSSGTLQAVPGDVDGLFLATDSTEPAGVDWEPGGGGGGVPSNTVVTETSFGQASTAGVAATQSRGDHTHGSPSLGTTAGTAAEGNDTRITGAQQRSTLTTKGDLYVATASATVARQGVGSDGQVLTADSAQTNGVRWVSPSVGTTLKVRKARITSGDISLNLGASWNRLTTITLLAIPAAVGDYVQLEAPLFMSQSGNAFLDLAVVVSAAAVRYASTDTATPAVEGLPALYKDPDTFRTSMGPWGFVVVSGDLDGGNVNFGVFANGTTGTLFASTAYPFQWQCKNFGAVDFA